MKTPICKTLNRKVFILIECLYELLCGYFTVHTARILQSSPDLAIFHERGQPRDYPPAVLLAEGLADNHRNRSLAVPRDCPLKIKFVCAVWTECLRYKKQTTLDWSCSCTIYTLSFFVSKTLFMSTLYVKYTHLKKLEQDCIKWWLVK